MGPKLKEREEQPYPMVNETIGKPVKFVPEYDYKSFFFSIPNGIYEGIIVEIAKVAANISALSKESNMTFFFSNSEMAGEFKKIAKEEGLNYEALVGEGRIKEVISGAGELWSQDFLEPAGKTSGNPVLIKGWTCSEDKLRKGARDKFDAGAGSMDAVTYRIPAVIEGGDITKTYSKGGKSYVVIGESSLKKTMKVYEELGKKCDENEILNIYKEAFGADEILEIRQSPFSTYQFHIDQNLFFPKEGVAVMAVPDAKGFLTGEQKEYLKWAGETKKQLQDAGFDVVEIPTAFSNIWESKAYTNSLTIKGDDGKTHIIMPSFGEKYSKIEGQIKSILEEKGFVVHFVRDWAYQWHGNIHCISGQIAFLEPEKEFFEKKI